MLGSLGKIMDTCPELVIAPCPPQKNYCLRGCHHSWLRYAGTAQQEQQGSTIPTRRSHSGQARRAELGQCGRPHAAESPDYWARLLGPGRSQLKLESQGSR